MQKSKLFLIHFAGGNCYSFQFILPYLNDFDVFPLELPGRGKRINEALSEDFESASQDLYKQILANISSNDFFIYGHSMGAGLGFKVTQLLEAAGRSPAYLFVSGNPGPGKGRVKKRSSLSRHDFVSELVHLGGMPPALIENEALLDFFMPVLRADFRLSEANQQSTASGTVDTPIYAFMGDQEEHAEDIDNWGSYTKSESKVKLFPGGHFFIYDHSQAIASIILNENDNRKIL